MKKDNCSGCHDDFYNTPQKDCFSLKNAKLILRKEVNAHQMPPFKQKAETFPNCYHRNQFFYIEPDREY
jgi:hypothetical protein